MMKMIVDANPDLETTNKPKQRWRQLVHAFITGTLFKHNYVDIFVMICIILNMFLLAMVFDDSSQVYNNTLDYINYFFTVVFALECVLKLIAFGGTYFNNSWNSFDFFVVCASGIDIVMGQLDTVNLKFLRVGPQLARILRVLRISRLFRLLNKYKGLQALIQTIQFSLPALFNVFALLMLIYFIFSILATFLFRTITEGNIIDDHNNFSNFGMSMLLLIRMSTGEDWNSVMQDTMRTEDDGCFPNKTCGISYAPLFFFPYMMLCTFIMLNLFILVIIQQFETYYLDEDNVISRFKEDIEMFKVTWTHFTKDLNCLKIKDTRLVAFMAQMEPPLGMRGEKMTDIIKSVMQMELVSDNEGFVYFNELLFRVMRRVYGEAHVKNKVLIESELVAIDKIQAIKQKMIKKSRGQERLKAAQVNPFSLQLFMNASFKGWHKLAMQNAERRKEEAEHGYGQIKMPTQGSLQIGGDRSYAQDDEDEHEELAYETIEDIEIDDSNSFVSEDMMDREYDEEDPEQDQQSLSQHESQGKYMRPNEVSLEKGPTTKSSGSVQVLYYPQQPMRVEDEFKEQEKESSSSGQHHLSNVQHSGFKKGSFAEDQTPGGVANSSRALIKRGRGESKRAQFRAEWLKKNNKQQHGGSTSNEQFDDSGEMEF